MAKRETIYFSHDADAHRDVKCLALIDRHGYEGYGIFWAIIETLRAEESHAWKASDMHLLSICFAFDKQKFEAIVSTCIEVGLLAVIDGDLIHSPSLSKRMNRMHEISESRKIAAQSRISSSDEQLLSKSSAKSPKGKGKSKVKDNPYSPLFDAFWLAYPRKENKVQAARVFDRLGATDELVQTMVQAVAVQSKKWTDPKFIPHASTWLNGRRWEDEIETQATAQATHYQRRD
jgi:hypothetical protein